MAQDTKDPRDIGHQYEMIKEDDENLLHLDTAPETPQPPEPPEDPFPEMVEEKPRRSWKWIMLLVALIVVILFVVMMLMQANGVDEAQDQPVAPAQSDTVMADPEVVVTEEVTEITGVLPATADTTSAQTLAATGTPVDSAAAAPVVSASAPSTASAATSTATQPQGDIQSLINRTIRGDFGNGDARRHALGTRYPQVQNAVNARLRC